MKSIHVILRFLHRPTLLAALAFAGLASTSQAVDFNRWVSVRGEWILIVPGSNTGGRVVYSPNHGLKITDRASRGETICVTPYATFAGEYVIGSYRRYTCGTTQMGWVALPGSQLFTVSTNPNCDSLTYTVCTQYQPAGVTRQIPIGSRP